MSEQPGGDHPDHDLLSDHAAGLVATPRLAARVEEHVHGCAACARLLADAEGVRAALRTLPPEPVPADVMSGIETVLARAAAGPEESPSTGPVPGAADRPARMLTPSVTAAPEGPRRRARQEDRSPRFDVRRLVPPPRWVAPAAAVLVVGVAGLGVVKALRPDPRTAADSTSTEAAGAAAGASAPVLAQVRQTGTNYRPDRLKAQVEALVRGAGAPSAGTQSLRGGDVQSGAAGLGEASSTRLTDPVALRECLVAIGEPDAQPVAVDLARYRGQDAAVIVLRNEGGSYDVWAVARNCQTGADGTIDIRTVTP